MGTLTQAENKVVPFEDIETSSDKDKCAHIVKVGKGESGTAAVLRARVEGLTVEVAINTSPIMRDYKGDWHGNAVH